MTEPFSEDEEELLIETDALDDETELGIDDREVTLEDVEVLEEEENLGHKVQTFDPSEEDDKYSSGAYFDE